MKTWVVKMLVTDCWLLSCPDENRPSKTACDLACARAPRFPCRKQVIFDGIEAENREDAVQAAELLAMMDRPWMERGKDIFDVNASPLDG